MKTMQAMMLEQYGGPHAFKERELPIPDPGAGEVRIRIDAVSVNPVDCKMRGGQLAVPLPTVLGRDVAGFVDAVGKDTGGGASGFAEGDRVMAVLFGPRSNGAYARYVTVPTAFVAHAPKTLSLAEAAATGVAGLTAYLAVNRAGSVSKSDAILVTGGAGGVGSFAIPLLRGRGIETIIATAGSETSRRYLVDSLGQDPKHVVNYRGKDVAALAADVAALAGPDGICQAFDFVGNEMKRPSFEAVGFEGSVVSVVEEGDKFSLPIWQPGGPMFEKSASYHFIATSARARYGAPDDWASYRRWLDDWMAIMASGDVTMPTVSVVGPLGEATLAEAHERLESGGTPGKLALTVE